MPNWKKIALSGSSPEFAALTVDTSIQAQSVTGSLLRLDENGTGLRLTNVGAFDNSSGNFRIFSNQDLILSTNGDNGTAVTIDQTTKDTTFVGAVTASAFTGSFTGTFAGVISSSAQIASDISGSFASASGSIASDIATLSSFSSSLETVQYNYTGSFSGDGSGLTGVETQVTEQTTITDDFTNVISKTVTHNFNTKNVLVSVYSIDDELILPSSTITTDSNTVDIAFDSTSSGRVVVAKGGHIVSGTAELYTYRENLTGSDNYTVTHSLDELYPVVQIYDTASNKQVIPGEIETLNSNSVKVTFDDTFSGLIVVKK